MLTRGSNKTTLRGTAINDNDVIFFDALVAFPAINDPVKADNNDATPTASLSPLANADDVELAVQSTGLLAVEIDAPLALEASS